MGEIVLEKKLHRIQGPNLTTKLIELLKETGVEVIDLKPGEVKKTLFIINKKKCHLLFSNITKPATKNVYFFGN